MPSIQIKDVRDLALTRASHRLLVPRCELRGNLTPYDAAYVSLAETLRVTLVTADGALAPAPGVPCDVEVLEA